MKQAPKVGDWVVRKYEFRVGDAAWTNFCENQGRRPEEAFQISHMSGITIKLVPNNRTNWHWNRFDIIQPIVEKSLEDYM